MTPKDILEIAVVPGALALIALLWPEIQSWSRRRAFRALILRELEEISPHPTKATLEGWWQHQKKQFIHRTVFAEASENLEFILSLEPDLVYFVTQLWQSLEEADWDQWHYILRECLSKTAYDKKGKIAKACTRWETLREEYQQLKFKQARARRA